MASRPGRPFDNPNGATISALDEARCRLIVAEENERKAAERLGRAYHYVKLANAEVSSAIAELTRLQHALGDTELVDRETHRIDELTVTVPAHLLPVAMANFHAQQRERTA